MKLADCNEFGWKFETTDAFWEEINEIIAVLQSSYDLTISMQKVGYGLADFYIGWLRVKKNLERFVNGKYYLIFPMHYSFTLIVHIIPF